MPSMNVRITNLAALFSKKLTIDSEPKIPSIQLKRFINTEIIGSKVLQELTYPRVLDLNPFTNVEQDNQVLYHYHSIFM